MARRTDQRKGPLAQTQDRGGRRRRLRLWFFALGLVGLLGAGAVAWRSGSEYLRTCERFNLEALEVRGLHLLQGSDVLAATGLAERDNIFCLDLDTIAARVDTMVWVRRARVGRRPPDRLLVTVEERRREAWLELGELLYAVDGDGVLLPARRHVGESRADLDLPILRLPPAIRDGEATSAPPAAGSVLADSALVALLGWWREARLANAEACAGISEIEPLGNDAVRLFLVADGLEVRMPMDQAGRHLAVLQKLLSRVYRECPGAAYVDLRYAGQAVVGRRGSAARQAGMAGRHG